MTFYCKNSCEFFDIFVVGNATKLRQDIKDKEKSSYIFM